MITTPHRRIVPCCVALVALALALAAAWTDPRTAAAQTPPELHLAYPLRYARAEILAAQLDGALRQLGLRADVVSDPANHRVLVRGSADVHRTVEALLASLDRPANAAPAAQPGSTHSAEPNELRTYRLPAEVLPLVAETLRREYAAVGEVRVATDPRTSQLLVLAPAGRHGDIAQRVYAVAQPMPELTQENGGPTVAQQPLGQPNHHHAPGRQEMLPAASGVSTLRVAVAGWMHVERRLQHTLREGFMRVSAPGQLPQYLLQFPNGGRVELTLHPDGNEVQLRGPYGLTELAARLVGALDRQGAQPEQTARVVRVSDPQSPALQRAVSAIRWTSQGRSHAAVMGSSRLIEQLGSGGHAATAPGAGVAALAQFFQERGPHAAEPPPAPALPTIQVGQPQPPQAVFLAQNQPPGTSAQPMGSNQPPLTAPPAQGNQPQPGQPQPGQPQPGQPPAGGEGLVGPVQIEFLEGLDVIIITGNQRDVERVLQIIQDIERLSVETEPVIEVYMLRHAGSEAVASIVTQLYDQILASRQGRVSVTPLVKPNALLLIGRGENVRVVIDLVQRLDQPVPPDSQFGVFPLQHASVAVVQSLLQEFFADRAGLGPRIRVTADFRTNALVVYGSPRDLVEAGELIKRLDVPSSEAVHEVRVIPLRSSLAEDLAAVLQAAISGQLLQRGVVPGVGQQLAQPVQPGQPGQAATAAQQQSLQAKSAMLRFLTVDAQGKRLLQSGILTDVRITADPRANALVVIGPSESMELIEALVRQLDQIPAAEAQIKVFTIVNGDALSLLQMLQNLFGQQAAGPGVTGVVSATENPLVPLRFSADQRTNSIIASGSAGDLQVVEAILLRLDESDVRQRQSKVYRLKNAPALDVATAINEFLRSERAVQQITPGVVSPFEQIEREVVVVPEIVSNSLILSATPRYFDEIRLLIEELDARPPMVMIQVLIAEVALNNTDEFGVELGLQDSVLFDRSLLGDLVTTTVSTQQAVPGGGTITTQDQVIQAATLTPGYLFNSPVLPNSGSSRSLASSNRVGTQGLTSFSLGRINGELGFGGLVFSASSESVSVLIRALSESRRLDVLSRPQVMTLDNQPAFIQVGSRVPRVRGVTTNEVGQTANVVDENVGLILGVTPRISPDGLVVMEIDAEKSALGPESEGVPISISATGEVVRQPVINTTTASTTVSAVSGQTVVLGGLITKTRSTVTRRVPYLSRIPVLGQLFRYDNVQQGRTELLIIMTPHIVRNEQDANIIKQVEAARMSWCLADVVKLHGDIGVWSPYADGADGRILTIYPDQYPDAPESLPTPATPQSSAPGNGAPSPQHPKLPPTGASQPPHSGARGGPAPVLQPAALRGATPPPPQAALAPVMPHAQAAGPMPAGTAQHALHMADAEAPLRPDNGTRPAPPGVLQPWEPGMSAWAADQGAPTRQANDAAAGGAPTPRAASSAPGDGQRLRYVPVAEAHGWEP
jgi:general secretion pathway protein D